MNGKSKLITVRNRGPYENNLHKQCTKTVNNNLFMFYTHIHICVIVHSNKLKKDYISCFLDFMKTHDKLASCTLT